MCLRQSLALVDPRGLPGCKAHSKPVHSFGPRTSSGVPSGGALPPGLDVSRIPRSFPRAGSPADSWGTGQSCALAADTDSWGTWLRANSAHMHNEGFKLVR